MTLKFKPHTTGLNQIKPYFYEKKTKKILQLDPSSVQVRLGLCAAALVGTAAPVFNADAAIIDFTTPIPVPDNFAGVYVNLGTGAFGAPSGAVTGWDFNPYETGSPGSGPIGFFWNSGAGAGTVGGVAGTTTGPYLSLAPGTVVGPASTFSATILGTVGSPYVTTGTWTLGFRFFNETTAAVNYGYLTLSTTVSNGAGTGPFDEFNTPKGPPIKGQLPDAGGFPATILGWSYENDGSPITVIPEPSTAALLTIGALAAGALGLRKWRRQRAA